MIIKEAIMYNTCRFIVLVFIPIVFLRGGYTINYAQSEFSFYKDHGYDRIKALEFALSGNPGAPELPVICLKYIIPPNTKAESLIISQFTITQIPGEYHIYPAQPSHIPGDSLAWVPPDTAIYNSDSLYPASFIKITGQGVMDGARIVTVNVTPVQYRPKTGRVYLITKANFEFALKFAPLPDLRPLRRGFQEQKVYDATLSSVVENDNELLSYYQKPALFEEQDLVVTEPPKGPSVIITDYYLTNVFQTYADWMTDQGVPTVIASIRQINYYYTGVDNAERMRNYIKDCWQNFGGTWFLLGGDYPYVPIRYACSMNNNPDPGVNHPCDMYFSNLDLTWNADGDGFWGELNDDYPQTDQFPDVFVGRLTVCGYDEIQNWTNKVLYYEKIPIFLQATTALWLVAPLDFGMGDAISRFPLFFNHIQRNNYPADDTKIDLDQGYGIVNIHCHGETRNFETTDTEFGDTNYVHRWWDQPPTHDNAGLNQLNNTNNYYPVYSLSCNNAGYDPNTPDFVTDTCVADAFVDAYASKGACAFIGNTRYGYIPQSKNLEYEFYKVLFKLSKGPSARLGYAEAISKTGSRIIWMQMPYRHMCYTNNLFGSPHTEVWTNWPGTMQVSHPVQIIVGVPLQFTVTVLDESGSPLRYAKVCLNKPNDIYQVGETNASGQAVFNITPQTTGTMKVTVTRPHNIDLNYAQFCPSQTTCQVVTGGGGQSQQANELRPRRLSIISLATVVNEEISVRFGIPEQGDVTLILHDVKGAVVQRSTIADLKSGYYRRCLNVAGLPNGIYVLVLRQNTSVATKKLVVVR